MRLGPYTLLIALTFVRLNGLKASTTRSSFPCGLISKYFRSRRSRVDDRGSRTALRDRPSGREESGHAPVRLSSAPVVTFTGRPDVMVRIGASDTCVSVRSHP